MNYLQKYLKYKQKYLELLNKINGGMSNWNIKGNLVTQIKRQDNNGNFYLENINILDLPEEMKKQKYTLDDEINTIKTEIIELYNLLDIENNKHEYELDKNINNITTIKNAILELLKNYNEEILDKQLLEDLGKFKKESSFYMKIENDIKKELIDEFNILSKDKQKQIFNDIINKLLFDEKKLYNKKTSD